MPRSQRNRDAHRKDEAAGERSLSGSLRAMNPFSSFGKDVDLPLEGATDSAKQRAMQRAKQTRKGLRNLRKIAQGKALEKDDE